MDRLFDIIQREAREIQREARERERRARAALVKTMQKDH
jgi:hypothetical protein